MIYYAYIYIPVCTRQEKGPMKFQVTYRLTHPHSLPTVSSTLVSAQTHQQLDQAISTLVLKWRAQGYTLHVLAVRKRSTGARLHWP